MIYLYLLRRTHFAYENKSGPTPACLSKQKRILALLKLNPKGNFHFHLNTNNIRNIRLYRTGSASFEPVCPKHWPKKARNPMQIYHWLANAAKAQIRVANLFPAAVLQMRRPRQCKSVMRTSAYHVRNVTSGSFHIFKSLFLPAVEHY